MSGRGRRGRGRPPKRAAISHRVNLLKKPRYLYAGSGNHGSRISTKPGESSPSRRGSHVHYRGRLREKSNRGRNFFSNILDYEGEDEIDENFSSDDSEYNREEDVEEEGNESDVSFPESDELSVYSQSSFSTISSTTPAKRKWCKRATTPVFLQERDYPILTLPKSSDDLLLPREYLMQALGVYEVLRHFRNILRLTPFLFEDFCASLSSTDQTALLSDIHIMLLKAILREEEAQGTMFAPLDMRDTVNIHFYLIDSMTWPAVLRMYLQSDPDYKDVLSVMKNCEYPFTSIESRLTVLEFLCDNFLTTSPARDDLISEGMIYHDDHCRACHKLGDLLCCETCPAVYHLACLDPPLQEVPTEDWTCAICKANQVPGVTDCISEIEKNMLLSRQECLGLDRHGRKYWFLCRRIIVEGEDASYYYTTKLQFQELMETLDANDLEYDVYRVLEDMKEEIIRQMDITEKLTNSAKGNKKSYLEVENAALAKIQSERAIQKAKEEEERRREAERIAAMMTSNLTDGSLNENDQWNNNNFPNSHHMDGSFEDQVKVGNNEEKHETDENPVKMNNHAELNSISENNADDKPKIKSEEISVKSENMECDDNSRSNEANISAEGGSDINEESSNAGSENNVDDPPKDNGESSEKSEESDSKKGIHLKIFAKGGKGNFIRLEKKEDDDTDSQKGGIVTRSKTGALTPRTFSNENKPVGNFVKTRKNGEESIIIVSKDGEITRMTTRSKSSNSASTGPTLYKLGMDSTGKPYSNQYTTNTLALNKHQHAEDRDKKRHLSHKFSLTAASEFKWQGSTYGDRGFTVATLRQAFLQLENNIPAYLLHAYWTIHRSNWLKAVNKCSAAPDFAFALNILEACMKPVLFTTVWNDSLGHVRLQRTTAVDREDRKKQEKREKREGPEEEVDRTMWVKYTLGLKHQVWKQKGEEYRITGQGGWRYISYTRTYKFKPCSELGLRAGPHKVVISEKGCEPRIMETKEYLMTVTDIPEDIKPLFSFASEVELKSEPSEEMDTDQLDVETVKQEPMDEDDSEEKKPVFKKKYIPKNVGVLTSYRLNPDLDIDLINVSEALVEKVRVTYPRIPKPSKLDEYLDIRLKTIEAQENATDQGDKKNPSNLVKVEVKSNNIPTQSVKLLVKKGATATEISRAIATKLGRRDLFKPKITKSLSNGEISGISVEDTKLTSTSLLKFPRRCYSPLCRAENTPQKLGGQCNCYSPSCRTFRSGQVIIVRKAPDQPNTKFNFINAAGIDKKIIPAKDSTKTETVIIKQISHCGLMNSESKVVNSATSHPLQTVPKTEDGNSSPDVKDESASGKAKPNCTNKELGTKGKAFLGKVRTSKKSKKTGKGVLPPCNKFNTPADIKSILVLPPHELRKLCRKGGLREAAGYNYNAKNNPYIWPYGTCPRPSFKLAWQFRTQTLTTIHEAALQLRVIWSCIRWDDVQAKPPPSGTNTISTETEVQTVELLQRRDVGMFGLRSEYLVRRITVPIDLPSKPRVKSTPQRSGLRERRRPESPENKLPTVSESWVPEEDLDLWEIREFGEMIEKKKREHLRDRQAHQQSQQSAEKIKAQMEAQLVQQRLALQQKRLLESGQGSKTPNKVTLSSNPKTSKITSVSSTSSTATVAKISLVSTTLSTSTTTTNVKTYPGIRRIFTSRTPKTDGKSLASLTTTTTKVPITTTILPKSPLVVRTPNAANTSNTATRPTVLTLGGQIVRQPVSNPTPAAASIRTQIQLIQGPNGQLQVRGLLPGQQLIRLSDGRLQLLTLPAQAVQQTQPEQTIQTVQQAQQVQLPALRPAISLAPAPTVTTGAAVATLATSTAMSISMPTVANIAAPGTIQLVTQGQTAQIKFQSPVAITPNLISTAGATVTTTPATSKLIQIRPQAPAVQTVARQVRPVAPVGQQVRIQTAATIPGLATVVQPGVTSAAPQVVTTAQTQVTTQTNKILLSPTPVKVTSPDGKQILASPTKVVTVTSKGDGTSQQFVLTNAIKQQIVRQALMNQHASPEIQQKLLAMQRHQQAQMQKQQLETDGKVTSPIKIATPIAPAIADKNKIKALTPEQKEDSQRLAVCQVVVKGIVDRVERDEKNTHRRQKSKESAEERKVRAGAAKQQTLLLRHTELLRKDILKKRAIMEKEIQLEIQAEVQDEVKKREAIAAIPPQAMSVQTPVVQPKVKKAVQQSPKPPVKVVKTPKSPKLAKSLPNKPIKVESQIKEDKIVKPPKKRKSQSSESDGIEQNTKTPAKKQKSAITKPADHKALDQRKLYCICKKPYDSKRFMIGCDLCSNWFHVECIGLTEVKAKSMSRYVCNDCTKATETAAEELYCLCRSPYDESQFYICCDRCQDWFHGRCVGVLQSEADSIDEYICPNCQSNTDINHANLKLLENKDYENIKRLLKSLMSHKHAWPFMKPVDPVEAPDYYKVIKEPMDLKTVEQRLNSHTYKKLADFIGDMTKIFDNCRYYNPRSSPFYNCAEMLESFFVQKIKLFRESIT
ncbi:nucleosome-remodeling factor subunit BPTF-like isoform X2 [Argiope bruennichi]|uniref:nucleosome-remodeling factor subunit BPTF-like isoform X2 n=1 Tax=Argiope bruennichi TaxID=94029 RepID=UPI0024952364|nr:nucleosome-remodeling factor subunit BPTF-like isoform X2 [Argiope bruennichi]